MTAAASVPNRDGHLDVEDGQHVYWQEWGNPAGAPILYVHGGPGGNLGKGGYRKRFDLDRTRLIGFEQRGCGRSTPTAADPATSLEVNTTAHLVADMEAIRIHLGIDRWGLSGGSWGSTLALAYATTHPGRVTAIALAAVTTTSRAEVDWITEGVGAIYPEAWERFVTHAESAGIGYRRGHGRLVQAYADLINSPDESVREAASREWALWEDTHISIGAGGLHRDPRWEDATFRHGLVRLVTHYWSHDGFCDPPLLHQTDRLAGIPATLIHGRRDVSSPARTAWELSQRWPDAQLLIDEGDGHSGASMSELWCTANHALAARTSLS